MTLHMNINVNLVLLMTNMAQNDLKVGHFFKSSNVCILRLQYHCQYIIHVKLNYTFVFLISIGIHPYITHTHIYISDVYKHPPKHTAK